MVRICVSGSEGKMGSRIISLAKEDGDLQVTGQFDIGQAAETSIGDCDCLIDFTVPKATMANLALCEKLKKAIVIGTTGLSEDDKAKIKEASSSIPIVLSPNMSIGVNLLFKLIEEASKTLGKEYDISIVEAHHTEKKDQSGNELVAFLDSFGQGKQCPRNLRVINQKVLTITIGRYVDGVYHTID